MMKINCPLYIFLNEYLSGGDRPYVMLSMKLTIQLFFTGWNQENRKQWIEGTAHCLRSRRAWKSSWWLVQIILGPRHSLQEPKAEAYCWNDPFLSLFRLRRLHEGGLRPFREIDQFREKADIREIKHLGDCNCNDNS